VCNKHTAAVDLVFLCVLLCDVFLSIFISLVRPEIIMGLKVGELRPVRYFKGELNVTVVKSFGAGVLVSLFICVLRVSYGAF
jgi:hypothetical protein